MSGKLFKQDAAEASGFGGGGPGEEFNFANSAERAGLLAEPEASRYS